MTIHEVKFTEELGEILMADPEHQLRLNHYRGRRTLTEPTVHDDSMLQFGTALQAAMIACIDQQNDYNTTYQ